MNQKTLQRNQTSIQSYIKPTKPKNILSATSSNSAVAKTAENHSNTASSKSLRKPIPWSWAQAKQ